MEEFKTYACFTPDQQRLFNGLTAKQKNYVLARGQGCSKTDACKVAGIGGKSPSHYGMEMEKLMYPFMPELISALSGMKAIEEKYKGIEQSFKEENAEEIIEEKAKECPTELKQYDPNLPSATQVDSEEAKRLTFYRSIVDGRYKTIKTTKTYDKDGKITGRKVEETCDIDVRMKARRELDRILGLSAVLDIGSISAGDIKITIVDASREDQKIDDQREESIEGEVVKDDDKL